MSLLSRPPHTVRVRNRVKAIESGTRGQAVYVASGDPITVNCAVQPVREWSTAEEIQVNGIQLLSLQRIFSRDWPGNMNSIVEWNGYDWETVGDPQQFGMSKLTAHWEVTVRRLGITAPEPEPEPGP